jgi:hypothetical protein
MSNSPKTSTEEVRFRHLARISKTAAKGFVEECSKRRWEPGKLLKAILEERYDGKPTSEV